MSRRCKVAALIIAPMCITIAFAYLVSELPVLLVPPFIQYTLLVYLIPVPLSWFPLAYFLYRSPESRKILLILPVLLCLGSTLFWCTLGGPVLGSMVSILIGEYSCDKQESESGRVIYVCTSLSSSDYEWEHFMLERWEGLPFFVQRID